MRCAASSSALIALFILSLSACQPAAAPSPTPVPQAIGVTPLYLDWTSASLANYRDGHEGANFSLDVYALDAGLEALEDGEIGLLVGAIEPEQSMFAAPLVQDGIAVVHNAELGVRSLSIEELRRIFAGGEQNWQAFGGEDLPIYPIIPLPGDGLRNIFQDRVLGTFQFSTLARLQASPEQTLTLVEEEPGAIGFVPFSQLGRDIAVFRIDGQAPSLRSIQNGSYPLSYWVSAIGENEPEGALRGWIGWVQAQND